ncbi:RNA-binding domain-containing protein [Colletotrichum zoysiae]|uniref:RNA-binding domain-containing protein n=1 Tax=Colletotrichum zoysiae TaxID=1216348 RepID=A0AAD9HE57_9PEZI|nr:RNA-binding domain-containing protein [Colletotrichum zoysiae]
MAYPPPPGTSSGPSIGNPPSHPSLPARPPPSKTSGGFKPAFKPAFGAAASPAAPPTYSSAPSYAPAPAASYGASYQSYPQHSSPAVGGAGPYQATPSSYTQYPQAGAGAGAGYGQATSYNAPPSTYGAAPQIRNPFPIPGSATDYEPDMAMQIAQWQSAYSSRDATTSRDAVGGPGGGRGAPATGGSAATPSAVPDPAAVAAAAAAANQPPERKKTVVREGGGKKWTDDSLTEWDPSHLRLFVGNLAGEVTDESLLKAFARWKSVQKARVIRDKRTAKSKGYGFVSFSDADDFFQAAKEMNGKYIQSHPVTVRKANTEIKITNVKDKDHHNNRKNKNKKHSGNGGGGGNKHAGEGTGYEPHLGPVHSHGVTKPGQKTKNGLKLLG